MVKRISHGYSERVIPEDVSKHLGYYCTKCGDTVSKPLDQCQGGCMTPEMIHSPYLFCVSCGDRVPDDEMSEKGLCCTCHEAIHLLHSDEPMEVS